jgi:hypothetical protein
MDKPIGIAMAVLGIALMIVSVISWNILDVSKWFPVLLIGGGSVVYFGIKKYRLA